LLDVYICTYYLCRQVSKDARNTFCEHRTHAIRLLAESRASWRLPQRLLTPRDWKAGFSHLVTWKAAGMRNLLQQPFSSLFLSSSLLLFSPRDSFFCNLKSLDTYRSVRIMYVFKGARERVVYLYNLIYITEREST
jgi:hypothetical protein